MRISPQQYKERVNEKFSRQFIKYNEVSSNKELKKLVTRPKALFNKSQISLESLNTS